jgi:hypothetical protein
MPCGNSDKIISELFAEGLMDLQNDTVTNDDLHAHLKSTLEGYPNLKSLIPVDWPEASKYGITLTAMKLFAEEKDDKATRYWHILNLPLCVHYAGLAVRLDKNQVKACSLMQSVLRVLEDFARQFSSLPGVRKTLEPLWTSAAWNVDPPELWSVLATAFMALQYSSNGQAVLGFGMKIGGGARDADIRMRQNDGTIIHVDIEAWHAVKFADLDAASARAQLLRRVEEKCGKKFRDLPNTEIGVAAVVCMAAGLEFRLMAKHADLAGLVQLDAMYERQYGYVYWVGGISDGTSLWVNVFDEKSLKQYVEKNSPLLADDRDLKPK